MSGLLSPENLRYIKAKCTAEGLEAFISIPEGTISPTKCSNCGGEGNIPIAFARVGLGFPVTFRNGLRYQIIDHADFPCPVCKSTNEQRLGIMLKLSGVPSHEWDWNINHIKGLAGKEDAYNSACAILGQAPMPTGFHLIYGNYGAGKSGLIKAITVSLVKAGVPSIYVGASDILSDIRATFNRNTSETEIDVISNYLEARFLAIDEVDVIGNTDWSLTTLQTLVDKRYESRSIKCTILATNRPPDQLWPYLASRCEDGYRIPIGGASLRGNAPVPVEPIGQPAEPDGWWNQM